MSVLFENRISILASSDPANGAKNVTEDGSSFDFTFQEPIYIDEKAHSCTVSLMTAAVWWNIPNITQGENAKFSIKIGATTYVPEVETGLYSLGSLQTSLESALINLGAPSGAWEFLSDSSTQKVIIRALQAGVEFDFTISESMRQVLGFDSQVLGPTVATVTDFIGDSIARFNQINYLEFHSDLVSQGMIKNGQYSSILAKVDLTVPPGSLNLFDPRHPARLPTPDLIGKRIQKIRVWVTDDQERLINTLGETFSCRMEIAWMSSEQGEY